MFLCQFDRKSTKKIRLNGFFRENVLGYLKIWPKSIIGWEMDAVYSVKKTKNSIKTEHSTFFIFKAVNEQNLVKQIKLAAAKLNVFTCNDEQQ